jgi:hypothetical protein
LNTTYRCREQLRRRTNKMKHEGRHKMQKKHIMLREHERRLNIVSRSTGRRCTMRKSKWERELQGAQSEQQR